MRAITLLLVVLAAGTGLSVAAAAGFRIQMRYSADRCLEYQPQNVPSDYGSNIILAACSDSSQQQFERIREQLQLVGTELCLDSMLTPDPISASTSGPPVSMANCTGNRQQQLWSTPGTKGGFLMSTADPSKCLDAIVDFPLNSPYMYLKCDPNNGNHYWIECALQNDTRPGCLHDGDLGFIPDAFHLHPATKDTCIQLANSTFIQNVTCDPGNPNQVFNWKGVGPTKGLGKLQLAEGGLCMSAAMENSTVTAEPCNQTQAQEWQHWSFTGPRQAMLQRAVGGFNLSLTAGSTDVSRPLSLDRSDLKRNEQRFEFQSILPAPAPAYSPAAAPAITSIPLAAPDQTSTQPAAPPQNSSSIPKTAVIALSVASAVLVLAALSLALYCWCFGCKRRHKPQAWEKPLQESIFRSYTLGEIRELTHNFSEERVLGQGGFATVYRGESRSGVVCAVKRHSKVLGDSFEREVKRVSDLRHRNLIKLLGYCVESKEHILIYELAVHGSVQDLLRKLATSASASSSREVTMGDSGAPPPPTMDAAGPSSAPRTEPTSFVAGAPLVLLSVQQRLAILRGAAEGLLYLHSHSIIHRDIKPGNILVHENLQPKLADFGIAKEVDQNPANQDAEAVVTCHVAGSRGYIDPEYYMDHRLSFKSDVYSLGVVMLEVITGRSPVITKEADLKLAHSDVTGSSADAGGSQAGVSPVPNPTDSWFRSLLSVGATQTGVGWNTRSFLASSGTGSATASSAMHLMEWVRSVRASQGAPTYLQSVLDLEFMDMETPMARLRPSLMDGHWCEGSKALDEFVGIALACSSPSETRPALRDVITQLTEVERQWNEWTSDMTNVEV